jgi:hypothetical protein
VVVGHDVAVIGNDHTGTRRMNGALVMLKWIQTENARTVTGADMDNTGHHLVCSRKKINMVGNIISCIRCTTRQN